MSELISFLWNKIALTHNSVNSKNNGQRLHCEKEKAQLFRYVYPHFSMNSQIKNGSRHRHGHDNCSAIRKTP